MDYRLKSVGIDIGTTTTQLIVSELILKNRMPGSRIPSLEITGKSILFESDIHFTPVIDYKIVNVQAIREIIEKEYRKAGIKQGEIDTGAVIITGETAKRENAGRIIHELASLAGGFVVAVAGPGLESVLAGKGSGAAELSKKRREIVANVDIGGGTTNIAVFENGNVIDTTCLNIGGRLVEVDPSDGTVRYIAEAGWKLAKHFGIHVQVGEKAGVNEIEKLAGHMSGIVLEVMKGSMLSDIAKELLMISPLKHTYKIDSIVFSGGVARYIYETFPRDGSFNRFIHGDIGPFLSEAIAGSGLTDSFNLLAPLHTIRATAIGAGAQSVSVSGSTIHIGEGLLPLKNVAISRVAWRRFPGEKKEISCKVREALDRFSPASGIHPAAILVPEPEVLSFRNVELLAAGILEGWECSHLREGTLVVLLEKDFAKVLGQCMSRLARGNGKFICIDRISVEDGDYIDIGKAIPGEDAVPVVIKTLVFGNQ